jgi:heme O synthase-like polyprenyltransferase
VPALGITAVLWWAGIALVIEPTKRRAHQLFHVSNFYLLIILLAVLLGSLLQVP